jgi:hypothetical protein
MAAWTAAAYADGEYEYSPAWASIENGVLTRTGTIQCPGGEPRRIALGYTGGRFLLAALVDTGPAARLYASEYASDHWSGFGEASPITQRETAMCFDGAGRLLFISDGRLFVKDGAVVHQLLSSDLLLENAGSLCAVDSSSGTVVLWKACTDAGYALCACVLSDMSVAVEPFVLSATENGMYSMLSSAECGGTLLLVYYHAGMTDDALEKSIEVIRIDGSVDIAVDAEWVYSSNALMPGAQVTTYLSALNAGLGDPGGIIAEIRSGDTVIASGSAADTLDLVFRWTVPSDYGGEAYSLTVLPVRGTDADLSNNTVALDNMIQSAAVAQTQYFGRIDGKDSVSVTIENTGLSETGRLTLTVRLLNSGETLLEQEIDSIPYGECTVARVELEPLEEETASLAFLLSSDSGTVDCSGNYLTITRPSPGTTEVVNVSWLDEEGEPIEGLTAAPIRVRYMVKNAGGAGREYTVILAAYTTDGQMLASSSGAAYIGASEYCDITAELDLSELGSGVCVKAFLLDESLSPIGSASQLN